jgi:hypothetical protein
MHMGKNRFATAIAIIFIAGAAQAETGAGASTSNFDITWITTPILQLLGTIILAFGTWATKRLLDWLGVKVSAQAAANIDQALEKAVTYGIQQTQETIKTKGWDHIDVREQAIAAALPYMQQHFADTLKSVGTDPNAEDIIKKALDRVFPQAVAKAAASPATPPTTAPIPQTTAGLATQPGVQQQILEKLPGG